MEEDMSSIVLNGVASEMAEVADSSGSTRTDLVVPLSTPPRKRAKHGGCRVSSSTKFKGVVLQQNGHWGAQIYANHQRVWLGTFKSETEAAMAYDSAAIRLRSGDSHRNFPWTDANSDEPKFQDHLTTDVLLNMIKDGSYPSKFQEFLCTTRFEDSVGAGSGAGSGPSLKGGMVVKQLFQKELTPSDVGKLNRLVIPKKHAVKHFPSIVAGSADADANAQLVFRDGAMRSWTFRYCYWRSSQSFVFTRGWNRFVKEKKLRENDTVTFFSCECGSAPEGMFFVIDVTRANGDAGDSGSADGGKGLNVLLNINQCANEVDEVEDRELSKKPVGFRLFGVQIC